MDILNRKALQNRSWLQWLCLLTSFKSLLSFVTLLLLSYSSLTWAANQPLNNNQLRFGNGGQGSINSSGNLLQPFYWSGSNWYKLTYGSYALDSAIGIGGDGSQSWNKNGSITDSFTLTNQTIDDSAYTSTSATEGYGTLISTGSVTVAGIPLQVQHTYVLGETTRFIKVTTRLKNTGSTTAENVRVWVGTRDDWVGTSDRPTKTRGVIQDDAFSQLSNSSDRSDAIKITSGAEGVLFYSTSPQVQTSISGCCSFSNVRNQDPATAPITLGGDGSYGFYVRMPDLAAGEQAEFDWYYAAGQIAELDAIIAEVSNAAAVSKEFNEDTILTLAADEFKDSNSAVYSKVKITSLPDPAKGVLKLSGSPVMLNQEIVSADYANVTYEPLAHVHGDDDFNWQGWSGTSYSSDSTFNLTILPVNDKPVITSATSASVNERQTAAIDIDAVEYDGELLTYSISGADAALFHIDPFTGVVTFVTAPEHIAHPDVGGDNQYDFVVTVSDGVEPVQVNVSITVLSLDSDGDLVPDPQEELEGTDPNDATNYLDSDQDGVPDFVELVGDSTDKNDRRSYVDSDGDGVPDYVEDNDPNMDDDSGNGVINYYVNFPINFQCDGNYFISQKDTLFQLDTSKTPFLFNDVSPAGYSGKIKLNAIGYNYQDGYIYGLKTGSNHLLRVESSGHMRDLGAISGLPVPDNGSYFIGDFDLEGNFYLIKGKSLYQIDIGSQSAIKRKLTGKYAASDIAYNPRDQKLYGVDQTRLFEINLSNKKLSSRVVTGLPSANYGSAWFDSAGRLYFSSNQTGDIYRIKELEQPVAEYVSKGKPTTSNDGTACAGKPSFEHTISPASTAPDSIVTHSYTIDNGLQQVHAGSGTISFNFEDLLSDGRTFVANSLTIEGAANTPVTNNYGDSNRLSLTGLQVAPDSSVVIYVNVNIPANLEGIYTNQAQISGLPQFLGGPTIASDHPGGTFPDKTPLVVIGPNTENSIGGRIFNDVNKNGVQDDGEVGVPGLELSLSNGSKTPTNDNGDYLFEALTDGSYSVSMITPEGYQQVSPLSITNINVSGGSESSGHNFAVKANASIVGWVFEDKNGNYKIDEEEAGIDGVLIALQRPDGTPLQTTRSDGDGYYEFTQLEPALYWVVETDKSGFSSLSPNIVSAHLASGQEFTAKFADLKNGTVSGVVFEDLNGDGELNGQESGLDNITVSYSGSSSGSTTTNDKGAYELNLAPGSYVIKEIDPANHVSITLNERRVTVTSTSTETVNFADVEEWTISGIVFDDADGDDNIGESEHGVEGIEVRLSNGDTTTTAPDGTFQFKGVNRNSYVGNYKVTINLIDGYTSKNRLFDRVDVVAGGSATTGFALARPGTIKGSVFNDLNGNGRKDSTELGISGALVKLTSDYGKQSLFTNSNGNFQFNGLIAGEYTLTEVDPEGFISSENRKVIPLKAGKSASAMFADRLVGVISGTVFNDFNGNKLLDQGEKGLAGVTVTLSGDHSATTITSSDGSYLFRGLTDGRYKVTQTPKAGFNISGDAEIEVDDPATTLSETNFANQPAGSISGKVFNDLNGDGDQQLPAEKGIGGIAVVLSGATDANTTTTADGSFLFLAVNDGSNTLSHTKLDGYQYINGQSKTLTINGGVAASHNFADQLILAPNAQPDRYLLTEGDTLTITASTGVLSNDLDLNGDALHVSAVTQPSRGSLNWNADGSFTYTPNSGMVTDQFTYRVSDGNNESDYVAVTIVNTIGEQCFSEPFVPVSNTIDSSWQVFNTGYTPTPVVTDGQFRLRLTETRKNIAGGVTKEFPIPSSGVVRFEFDSYQFGGNGADGMTFILSDWNVAPALGGAGGSLGYANRSKISGFAGGWLGIGFDAWGNFSRASEGKKGGVGFTKNAVAVRGSGSGTTGYHYLTGTRSLTPNINNSSAGHLYRITLDSSDNTHAYLTVERDVKDGRGYHTLIENHDVLSHPSQAALPAHFRLSLVASTGGKINYHDVAELLVRSSTCSSVMAFTVNNTPAEVSWNKALFNIELSQPAPAGGVTVNYSTFDGSAKSGSHYVANSGTLSFAQGERQKSVTVALKTLTAEDDGKQFYLQLSNPSANVYIGEANAIATLNWDNTDSDGDKVPDWIEIDEGTDPNDPKGYPDGDGDKVPDYVEVTEDGSDPNSDSGFDDADGDTIPDYIEEMAYSYACNADVYQSRGHQIFRVDSSVLPFSYQAVGPEAAGISLNALGFNYVDGYLYGMSTEKGKRNHLIRIDASGNFTDLGAVTNLPNDDFIRGDFDLNGLYYLSVKSALYAIDVQSVAVNKSYALNTQKGIDIAFNPRDGKIYSADRKRVKITDLSSGKIIQHKIRNMPADAGKFGSHWFDSRGSLFVSANQSEDVYRIDTPATNPTAHYIGRGINQGSPYDAAACVGAPVLTHTIEQPTLSHAGTVTHTYVIDNGLASGDAMGDPLLTGLLDTLSDGRLFVAGSLRVTGAQSAVTENNYGGTNTLSLSQLQVPANTQVTIQIDVTVPVLAPGLYYNQAQLTQIPVGLGGDSNRRLASDYPLSFINPDPTPLEFTGPNNQISGVAFNDYDGDGQQDDNEPGLRGVLVKLNSQQSTLTDAQGAYQFSYLSNGTHGVAATKLNSGFEAITPESVGNIALTGGQSQTVNFAYAKGDGAISGVVYDHQKESIEPIAGVTLTLKDKNNATLQTATTNDSGFYKFNGLLPALYWVESSATGYFATDAELKSTQVVSQQASPLDFNYVQPSSISGTVFNDFNGDSKQNNQEQGLAKATVSLYLANGVKQSEAVTLANGRYQFTGLAAGAYYVEQTDLTTPDAYTSVTANKVPVNLAAASAAVVHFADQETATISGIVYVDENSNGQQDDSELTLDNVTVTLSDAGDTRSSAGATLQTDNNGRYQFENIVAGNYQVQIDDVVGYLSHEKIDVTVAPGGAGNANFGLLEPGVISGRLFNDSDLDGEPSAQEAGLNGMQVVLKQGEAIRYTFTDEHGYYAFEQLAPADYNVSFTTPNGYLAAKNSESVTLANRETQQAHFALNIAGTVTGIVVNDLNGNQKRDPGESNLSGVEIALPGYGTATTDANGRYRFAFVSDGKYDVQATTPTGFISASDTVPVDVNGNSVTADFFLRLGGTVSGRVVNDINGDQVIDAKEKGIAGVAVELSNKDRSVVKSVATDAHGNFLFVALAAGDYTLTSTDLAGYLSVPANNNQTDFTLASAKAHSHIFFDQRIIAPVAKDDSFTLDEGATLTLTAATGLLVNDTDENSDQLTAVKDAMDVAHGSLTLNDDGSLVYQHNGSENFSDSFTYKAYDGSVYSNIATVSFTINPVNDIPVLGGSLDGNNTEDTTFKANGQITIQDGDAGQSFVVAQSDVSGLYGTFNIDQQGRWEYDLNNSLPAIQSLPTGATLTDSFVVSSLDGSVQKTVTITIKGVNDKPEAVDDVLTINEDTKNVPITVLSNDRDIDGDTLTVSSASLAANPNSGTVSVSSNQLLFTPAKDFVGEAQIDYCISDGAASDCAKVLVTVENVNDAPVAIDDVAVTFANQPVKVASAGNDYDIDSPFSITEASVDQGRVTIEDNGELLFTPATDFIGSAWIDYTISDGKLTDSAKVEVVITRDPSIVINNPPVATDDVYTLTNWDKVLLDVLLNDTDVENDALTLVSVETEVGEVSVVEGKVQFTPVQGQLGDVVLDYTIVDSEGQLAQAQVSIRFDIDEAELQPDITVPPARCGQFEVNANALYTRVDLGVAQAVDRFGNALPVSLLNDNPLFPPGVNQAYWKTTDADGRVTIASQKVCVKPLVSLKKDQVALEGETVRVGVYLNGEAEAYPVVLPYTVSGTADSSDHNLSSGTVTIQAGTDAEIVLETLADAIAEPDETIIITLGSDLNRGAKFSHTITIKEGNLTPELNLMVTQNQQPRMVVTPDGGSVVITADVYDPNEGDVFTFEWSASDAALSNDSAQAHQYRLDPSQLRAGIYQVALKVTDSANNPLSVTRSVYLQVVDQLPVLSSDDSDGDQIPDSLEGFADQDQDGIPDYLDRIDECNVLTQESKQQDGYLVEGEPGVCLRRGDFTLNGQSGGAFISDKDVEAQIQGITNDTEAVNIGGIFDFIAYGLPENSQSISIVLPQRKPIPVNAVYRKFAPQKGWVDFVEDQRNSLWSTQGEPGYCPPPNSSLWQQGLNKGHWCVQVKIEDGGINDDDGQKNGAVVDPGYVGVRSSGNQLPVAQNSQRTLPVNAAEEQIELSGLISDPDAGDVLEVTSASASFGSVTINGQQLVYKSLAGYGGNDLIRYGVSDGHGGTAYGEITISFLANEAPTHGVIQPIEINQGESSPSMNIMDNVTDKEGDAVSLTEAQAANGTVDFSADGKLIYTPNADFHGEETIRYKVQDSHGNVSESSFTIKVISYAVLASKTKSSGGSAGTLGLALLALLLLLRQQGGKLLARALLPLGLLMLSLSQQAKASEQSDCPLSWQESCSGFAHWYLGGQLGQAKTDISQGDVNDAFQDAGLMARSVSLKNSDLSWSLFAGYQFNPYIAVQLGYLDLGGRELHFSGETHDLSAYYDAAEHVYPNTGKGFNASAVLSWPLSERIKLSGKVGLFNWSQDYTTFNGTNEAGDDQTDGLDLIWGAEASYRLNHQWQLFAALDGMELEKQDLTNLSAGVRYFFGGQAKSPRREPEPAQAKLVQPEPEEIVQVIAEPPKREPFTGELQGVLFETASAEITPKYQKVLEHAVTILKVYPSLHVTINAHTDWVGKGVDNQKLSERRAASVMQFLLQHGISAERLTSYSFGEMKKVANNRTAEGRRLNRRVELEITTAESKEMRLTKEL